MATADADRPERTDVPTTPYQFDLPSELWDSYKRTVPATMSVKRSMRGLVARAVLTSSRTQPTPPMVGGEVVDGELWQEWTDSVPRSVALSDRLAEVIRADLLAGRRGGYGDMEERTARLMADRIKHRTQSAKAALERDGVECEKAADNLEKVIEIAEQFDA